MTSKVSFVLTQQWCTWNIGVKAAVTRHLVPLFHSERSGKTEELLLIGNEVMASSCAGEIQIGY